MKRQLVLLLFLVGSLVANAQSTFAPLGAEWWYYTSPGINNEFYIVEHAVSASDTTIMETSCKKITAESYARHIYTPANLHYSAKPTLYVYDQNDTVFVFNTIFNRFTPLLIFNAQVGDTICLPIPPSYTPDFRINPLTNDTSFCFVIQSIQMELYDTAYLKTFYTRSIEDFSQNSSIGAYPSYNWGYGNGKYTEKIGGAWSLLPVHGTNTADGGEVPLGASGNFRCYIDTQYSIKMLSIACDSMLYSLGIHDVKERGGAFSIYPNPSNGTFTLQSKKSLAEDAIVTVTDISGRTIITTVFPAVKDKIQIHTGQLQSGIYLVFVETSQGRYCQKMMLRP